MISSERANSFSNPLVQQVNEVLAEADREVLELAIDLKLLAREL